MKKKITVLYRNISISAHIDAGKTTTTERILYYCGIKNKIGEVHEGNTDMDWMPQEQERGITITSACTSVFWKNIFYRKYLNKNSTEYKINIIDTPGHIDFTVEVERSMRVVDGVCMIYCSVGGVQSQSESVWRQSVRYNVPKIIYVNKMDRVGNDYYRIYNQIKNMLAGNPLILFLPYFNNDSIFLGLIDLINFKLIIWDNLNDKGKSFILNDLPLNSLETFNIWRSDLIDKLTIDNDILINKFLFQKQIFNYEIIKIIRYKTITCEIQPMLCGSSFKNKGVQCLLDCITSFLPSPLDVSTYKGYDLENNKIFRKPLINEHFSSYIFKIMNDSFIGQLIFFRVYSGKIKLGDYIFNSVKIKKYRLNRILQIHANKKEDLKEISTGDIGAFIGFKDSLTGETLCDFNFPIVYDKIIFPEPVISQSVKLKKKIDQEKLSIAFQKLSIEDPSFKYNFNNDFNEIIISGMGELHLEVIIDRVKRDYNIDLDLGEPRVSYRETITKSFKNSEGKYIKQSGGRGQYGHVVINVEPNKRGSGNIIYNKIKGGVIPKEYISCIEESINDCFNSGFLLGFPVVDIIVYLVFGSFHEVDSSENAFKIAASIAFKNALKNSDSILLEPIMLVKIETPSDFIGLITSDINSRRGVLIHVNDDFNNYKIIESNIPLSEMFGYSTSLRSLTKGRAVYNMVFKNYLEVSKFLMCKILNK